MVRTDADEETVRPATPPAGRRGARARRHLPLRVRAGVAFGLMSLLLSSALALAAHALVRSSLLSERETVAQRQAYTNARLLRTRIDPPPPDMSQLLAGLQVGGAGDSVLLVGGRWYSSSVQVTAAEVPGSLAEAVAAGRAGVQRFEHFDTPALAVGVPIAAAGAQYFEITSLDEVESTLSNLGRSLSLAALAATVVGGVLGAGLSSAILRPLRRFALVAERIARADPATDPGTGAGEQSGAGRRLDAAGDADLEPLAASFNEMLDELDERIERERRFASDVSHEIRGPVAALASAVSIVDRRRDQLPAEVVPVIEMLDEQVRAFNGLVLDLLEISRFDARTATLEPEDTDLLALCEEVVQTRGFDGVPVEGPEPLPVRVDRRRIQQVLSNLLENAQRYAGGATHVRLEQVPAGDGGERVRVRVEDRGPGVAPAEREAIFERFARGRASESPNSPAGTGLGLAVTRQHVELHGGRIWVEDRPGGGASFVVELPEVPAA